MNIIQIRNTDIRSADKAFAEFMNNTESYLNDLAKRNNDLFKSANGLKLENHVLNALHEIAPSTPFRK